MPVLQYVYQSINFENCAGTTTVQVSLKPGYYWLISGPAPRTPIGYGTIEHLFIHSAEGVIGIDEAIMLDAIDFTILDPKEDHAFGHPIGTVGDERLWIDGDLNYAPFPSQPGPS